MKTVRFWAVATVLGLTVVTAVYWLAPATMGQARHQTLVPEHERLVHKIVEADAQEPVTRVLEVLGGRGSEIGVSIRDLGDADVKAGKSGVQIDDVREESPAAKAGIKSGDVVLSFDGERVRSARQFARLVQETPAGRSVKAQVERDGKTVDLTVTPDAGRRAEVIERQRLLAPGGAAPAFRWDADDLAGAFGAIPRGDFKFEFLDRPGRLGVGVQSLTPELAEYFGVKEGVLVTSVNKESPAAKAGLKAGDVITTVDGAAVDDTGELQRRLWKNEAATEVSLGVVRDRKAMAMKVPVEGTEPRTPSKTPRTRV